MGEQTEQPTDKRSGSDRRGADRRGEEERRKYVDVVDFERRHKDTRRVGSRRNGPRRQENA